MNAYRQKIIDRLYRAPLPVPETHRTLLPAAVLLPIVERSEPGLLLTRRTEHLPAHAGQISFPGGRKQPSDADLVATALRETEEEIGIPRHRVEIGGMLEPFETVSGYSVLPVVGFVPGGLTLTPDASEVAEAFEVPLDFLLDTRRYEQKMVTRNGVPRSYYEIHWGPHRIWGATASMLRHLAEKLG